MDKIWDRNTSKSEPTKVEHLKRKVTKWRNKSITNVPSQCIPSAATWYPIGQIHLNEPCVLAQRNAHWFNGPSHSLISGEKHHIGVYLFILCRKSFNFKM